MRVAIADQLADAPLNRIDCHRRLRRTCSIALPLGLLLANALSCNNGGPVASNDSCGHGWKGAQSVATHAGAAQQLDFRDVGYCATDPVTVRFERDGTRVTLGAVAASPIQVGVPVWVDPKTGRVGDVDLSVTIIGPDGEHPLANPMHVDPLPAPRAGAAPGHRALVMLGSVQSAITDARAKLSRFKGDVSAFDAELAKADASLATLTQAIGDVQRGGIPVPLLTVPGGATIVLSADSLTMLDGIFASFLVGLGSASGSASLSGRGLHILDMASDDAGDAAWFQNMVHDVSKGGLDSAKKFASATSGVLGVLAVGAAIAGAAPELTTLAVLGAVAFAATTLAPAATALLIDLGTLATSGDVTGPLDPRVWKATQPALKYAVEQGLAKVAGEVAQANLEPAAGPVGAAVFALADTTLGATAGAAHRVGDVLFGKDEACADGVIPYEIGFNPDYAKCRPPETGTGGTSGSSGSSGGGAGGATDPNNVCIVGAGVQANPSNFVKTCAFVAARERRGGSRPLFCADPNPQYRLGYPQLSNGDDPRIVCVVQTNEDAIAAGTNGESGCDHEVAGTCYCCP